MYRIILEGVGKALIFEDTNYTLVVVLMIGEGQISAILSVYYRTVLGEVVRVYMFCK
jgi:hypothetical protein